MDQKPTALPLKSPRQALRARPKHPDPNPRKKVVRCLSLKPKAGQKMEMQACLRATWWEGLELELEIPRGVPGHHPHKELVELVGQHLLRRSNSTGYLTTRLHPENSVHSIKHLPAKEHPKLDQSHQTQEVEAGRHPLPLFLRVLVDPSQQEKAPKHHPQRQGWGSPISVRHRRGPNLSTNRQGCGLRDLLAQTPVCLSRSRRRLLKKGVKQLSKLLN
mmetsp:Transcript_14820/g.19446  ORF Transcript_14820/g.19446 Transcript_14820/m.19446 type:complete len:218 (+) Transcript_14820:1426-2079(+)